jgi:ribosomal protein S18 acetylase RimI-like enzyme
VAGWRRVQVSYRWAVDEVTFSVVDAASDRARWAMAQYFEELNARFPDGFDYGTAFDEAAVGLNPPNGAFVVVTDAGDLVGCGGIQFLASDTADIKRMWVSSQRRGLGLGKRLLAYLEDEIQASGRSTVVLDTNQSLTEAIAMYRSSGYEPIDRYNDNPYAQLWFAKSLVSSAPTRDDASMK